MIDIHSHILPGIDDGAQGMEESIEMARLYLKNGIDKVIVTPHYIEGAGSTTLNENKVVLKKLKHVLKEEGIELELYIGNEIYVTPDILNYVIEKRVATLNETKYVLIELPMYDMPRYIENIIYELCLKEYVPIIAHPERNIRIQQDPNILYGFIMGGALAQINLPSLEGRYGEASKVTGELLLNHNMIHFIGTDAHSPRVRSPRIEESLEILKDIVDEDIFQKITYLNGQALLEDNHVSVEEPIEYVKEKKGFFSFLKSKIGLF